MDSNITINIVEPGSGPVVPNTGLFTSSIGGPEITTISISAVLILTMVAIIITALLYRKQKKSGKVTKLVHVVDSTKAVLKSKKRVTAGLTAIALLASAGTLTTLLANAGKSNTNAIEEDGLTLDVTGGDITIEVGDEPVFAVAEVKATVKEATQAGYTLTAYTDNTDLVSTTDGSKTIPMIAVDEGELAALADNTYGLSLTKPASQAEGVFTALSTDADNPTLLAEKEEGTEANDTTTIYYGFYITPDTPYGTYTSGDVYYDVEEKLGLATVTYDGNGLTFDGGKTTNVVKYEQGVTSLTELHSHTPNVSYDGAQIPGVKYPLNLNQTFVYQFADATTINLNIVQTGNEGCCGPDSDDYFSFWAGSHSEYTALADYDSAERAFGNTTGKYVFGDYNNVNTNIDVSAPEEQNSITFAYTTNNVRKDSSGGGSNGYGYYAIITATDADGNPAYAMGNVEVEGGGEYKVPTSTMEGYTFLGWSTDPNASSAAYTSASDIVANLPLNKGEKVTLYAIWSPAAFTINYNGNGNTAGGMVSDSTTLSHSDVLVGTVVNLYAPNYKKDGYGFAGWSTDADAWTHLTDDDATNDPTIYGPNQTISPNMAMAKSTLETKSATLYAVWVPAEKNNGTPVTLQGWTGCGSLDASSYDAETGKFNVGANTITALTDSRDGEVYTVAKLADGNCWTVENLRLDNSTTHESTTFALSQDNTNNPSLPLKNNYSTSATSNRLSVSSNSWCTDYDQESCYDQSIINTNNTNLGGAGLTASYNANNDSSQWYSYGNNYNWYSATAGRGTRSVESGTVAGDICPTGWHLPYGGSSTDEKGGDTSGGFYFLNGKIGNSANSWRSFPNNFVYSGDWYGSSAYSRGDYGYYWSSTAFGTSYAYTLYFSSGNVRPGTDDYAKRYGLSVRCVAPTE